MNAVIAVFDVVESDDYNRIIVNGLLCSFLMLGNNHYAIIPIPDFVDMILKGDDVAMYYLLHNRLNHRLHERYNDYQQQLYDNFEDIIEDFFLYLREHGRYPYQSLRRIKNRDAFETWLLNTFRNYLSNLPSPPI